MIYTFCRNTSTQLLRFNHWPKLRCASCVTQGGKPSFSVSPQGPGQSPPRIPTTPRPHTRQGNSLTKHDRRDEAQAEKKIRFCEKLSQYEPNDSGKCVIELPLEWKQLPDIQQGLRTQKSWPQEYKLRITLPRGFNIRYLTLVSGILVTARSRSCRVCVSRVSHV